MCEMRRSRFSAEVEIVTLVNLENHPKLACCLGLARDAMVPWLLPRVTVTAQSAQCAPWLQLRERNNQKGILFIPKERDKSGELCFTFLPPWATSTQSVVWNAAELEIKAHQRKRYFSFSSSLFLQTQTQPGIPPDSLLYSSVLKELREGLARL